MPTHRPRLTELCVSEFSELTRRAKQTVVKRIEAAGIKPIRVDGKTLYYDPHLVLPALYHEGEALNPQSEKARLDASRAALAELEFKKRSGLLVDSLDAQSLGASFAAGVAQRVLGLRTLAPLIRAAETDEEGASILEEGARDALSEVSRMGDVVAELSRRAGASAPGMDLGDEAAAEADGERMGGRGAQALS